MNFEALEVVGTKERDRQAKLQGRIFCCTSTACMSAGAGQVHTMLDQAVAVSQSDEFETEVVKTGCMGLCSHGPVVRAEEKDKAAALYGNVNPELAQQIVSRHFPVEEALEEIDSDEPDQSVTPHDIPHFRASLRKAQAKTELDKNIISLEDPFFTKQVRVVLSDTGRIDPDRLEDYLAHGGYQGLAKVLETMTPEEVCTEILESGLRGRGGAGFPSGIKWNFVRQEEAEQKFVIVNGDEGDPGAYMDRTIMEADPHRVLEGMMICAYAVGADYGYLYIRGEYPMAIERIRNAIRAARRHGVLGNKVLGTDFSFKADVRIGAGAFVCGEETALIHSVEGKRGMPRIRPPYPSKSGLWSAPTVINNVETMANVPSIIQNGATWYADIGTEKSKGTKVFALTGHLRNTGLIEVPMGITLREIVYDIGGGIPGDKEFKAAQTGGPSGGCIPAEYLDTPVDYESLTELGSIMGSGGLVIIDDSTTMPDFAKFFMDFCVDESCGKCLPCRVGTVQISKLLDKLISGEGQPEDLDKLDELCQMVQTTSLCGLGQSAPNPVLSTLKYFREEYDTLVQSPETVEAGVK
ncbi:MAG: NADH-quinone oxidoreductase subunit L [Chloroflexi bacterium]|nr:MAG: NADH-quinone oxidoreductase subunit L [Chloroflexota bacterium]MBL1195506.1 NADH-quinone oxidoreductase subunit L [Chloroflexota bacterium]NOH12788.1 NADH-quinone oxidoreductase subunit L [Chloroflexota bacterium]